MSHRIVIATNNQHKMHEIREILPGWDCVSLRDAGLASDPEETGRTFAENAAIKACAVHDMTGGAAAADDSGLCIDAFDGGPGVFSSRFLGEDTPYDIKNSIILDRLRDVPWERRGAQFVCDVCYVDEDGGRHVFEGVCPGHIGYEPRGDNGFGYDPIFVPDCDPSRTTAQMTDDEKNAISHRGMAFRLLAGYLDGQTQEQMPG